MGGKTVQLLYGKSEPIGAIIIDISSNLPHDWIFKDWRHAVHFLRYAMHKFERFHITHEVYDEWQHRYLVDAADDADDDICFSGNLNEHDDIDIDVMGVRIGADTDLKQKNLHLRFDEPDDDDDDDDDDD